MKIKKPQLKKNREQTNTADSNVFDLTGNGSGSTQFDLTGKSSGNAAFDLTGQSASNAGRKKKASGDRAGRFSGFRRGRQTQSSAQVQDTFGLMQQDDDAFEVTVRNAEPIIRRINADVSKKGKKKRALPRLLTRDLQLNLATASIITLLFAMLLTAADVTEMIPFALPGFAVFMLIATLDSSEDEKVRRIRRYLALAGLVALIAVLVIFRKYIGNGWAIIMNSLYDMGELEQAYIYNRFPVGELGDEHPYRSMHFALIWGSCLLGLIAAMPPERFRRTVAMIASAAAMIAYAYYGLIPSTVCIALIAVAIFFALSRGSFLSSLTVLLVTALAFGAIVFIDPGESWDISRADENFRDRFALRSSYLESSEPDMDEYETPEDMEFEGDEAFDDEGGILSENKSLVALGFVLIILAAIAAAFIMFMRRIRKRQAQNRAGINSTDPKEAIIAMFPYTVRWLQPLGIETSGRNFASLLPVVRRELSTNYAERFAKMYEIWQEAAYSDHDMSVIRQNEMKGFMSDTITMAKNRSDLKTKILNTFKYAL